MKIFGLLAVTVIGIMLLYAVGDFPDWADPASPASLHLSPHYITETIEETSVPNIVTSVLADYRGFDTMFETTVILAAGLAVLIILRRYRKKDIDDEDGDWKYEVSYQDTITQTVCRVMVPFMQLFALYVIAHGHHSPGGGFQGGVILGASFILLGISYDLKTILSRMREKSNIILANIGVLIYAGIGFLALLLGANYLDYSILSAILPSVTPVEARSLAMLGVEIGVGITVMAIVISVYTNLASHGRHDRGL
ncbi:MAG: sodium:proton antiporter [Deltaproteobacteria bacterium]|nr:sodium:proton antiporter [Deltaproteobacteria bacterium]